MPVFFVKEGGLKCGTKTSMKSLSTAALFLLIGSVAHAQTADWYAARFGFNAPAADLFASQTSSDYKNYAYNSGKPAARWNNTAAMMTGMGMVQAITGMAWSDPSNHSWTDLYEMTDLLPKNTWVRVTGNLQNHYPNPYNPIGHINSERCLQAVIGRIMFRGSDLSNGLNILWNLTPGVYPTEATSDSWSTITTDPYGAKLATPLSMGDPARRDWWRPADEYLPYLRNNAQSFVYDVNNAAANIVRQRTGSGTMTENFIARMGFQMGNEPAAGHPGGSVDGAVGSWTGVGKVLERTLAGLDYRPSPANMANNQVPSTFGTNPLIMPAFSMFSENIDSYRLNYTKGQLRNIQWGGNLAPVLNELSTYYAEMDGLTWQPSCKRRALHFNSPIYRWKFNPTAVYNSTKPDDLLTGKPFDPSSGRWETPQEYAKRWVNELEKQVNIVANQPMIGRSKVVDITECYFGGAHSYAAVLDPGVKNSDGSSVNFTAMSFDQVRALARTTTNDNGVLRPLQQQPASRESLLAAIRTELYNRDIAKTLTPYLGRIYWWGGYYADPRTETGLCNDTSNSVTGYNPWGDYRLTLSEVKALWNK